jgi:hypothetical protein
MELLLNLAWLLLALPACWLWRNSRRSRGEQAITSYQCLLALGCVLVILFPVISATDDLMAMRTEMEESPISKRSIRQASGDKSSLWTLRLQFPPVLAGSPSSFSLATEHGHIFVSLSLSLSAAPSVLTAGRAPPQVCIA